MTFNSWMINLQIPDFLIVVMVVWHHFDKVFGMIGNYLVLPQYFLEYIRYLHEGANHLLVYSNKHNLRLFISSNLLATKKKWVQLCSNVSKNGFDLLKPLAGWLETGSYGMNHTIFLKLWVKIESFKVKVPAKPDFVF